MLLWINENEMSWCCYELTKIILIIITSVGAFKSYLFKKAKIMRLLSNCGYSYLNKTKFFKKYRLTVWVFVFEVILRVTYHHPKTRETIFASAFFYDCPKYVNYKFLKMKMDCHWRIWLYSLTLLKLDFSKGIQFKVFLW